MAHLHCSYFCDCVCFWLRLNGFQGLTASNIMGISVVDIFGICVLIITPGAPLTNFNDGGGGGGGSDRGSYFIPQKITIFLSIPKKIP